MQIVKMPLLIT